MSGTLVPANTRKERLSLAYIKAVAARAGFDALETRIDIDSVDGSLKSTSGRRPQIDFQAKATSRAILKDDHIAFPLPLKNYDDLRADTVVPRILVVFFMPDDELSWLSQTENEMTIKHCAYWISLRGRPNSENSGTVTVHLPRDQIFDDNQLMALMTKAEREPNL